MNTEDKTPGAGDSGQEDEKPLTSLPDQNWGDPDGDGILADMARVFDNKTDEVPKDEHPKDESKESDKLEKSNNKEKSKAKDDDDLIEDDFFDEEESKKEEEKKPEKDDFDSETEKLAEGLDAKAGPKFKELRAELKEAKSKSITPEIQARLDELELKVKESEGLKERLEVLSNVSARVKMEQSPEYRAEVLEPAADVFDTVDKIAAMYEMDPSVIRNILRVNDRKEQNELIREHLAEFSDFDRSEVYRSIQDFNALSKHRERMLENAEAKVTEFETRRAEAEIKAREAERLGIQTIQKSIWDKYKEIIPGLLDEDGDPTPAMDRLMARGLSVDFSKAKAKDQAFAAFSGVLLPHLMNEVKQLQIKLLEYEKEDKKQTKRLAKIGETVAAGDTKSSNEPQDFMTEFLSKKF